MFSYLSPKPAEAYVWKKDVAYEPGSTVWYKGIFYYFIRPFGEVSVIGTPPNEEVATFDATDGNFGFEPPSEIQTRSARSWIMVDPRADINDPSRQTLLDVPGANAALTSAALRGVPALALVTNETSYNQKEGEPNYYGDYMTFLGAKPGNINLSWDYHLVSPGLSTNYGESRTIYAVWYDFSVSPPERKWDAVGSYTATNDYLLMSGGLGGTTGGFNQNVLNAGEPPVSGFNLDNDGYLEAVRNIELKIPGSQTPNDSIGGPLTGTYTFSQNLTFSNRLDPVTLTVINGLFGTKVSCRFILFYHTYVEVSVPGAYLTDPDITKYYRTGGTLVKLSGDGVTTPRVYQWQPPYEKSVYTVVNTGEITLTATHNAYQNPATITYVHTFAGELINVAGYSGVYNKTLTPGLPQ